MYEYYNSYVNKKERVLPNGADRNWICYVPMNRTARLKKKNLKIKFVFNLKMENNKQVRFLDRLDQIIRRKN